MTRDELLAAFIDAVIACDPTPRVAAATASISTSGKVIGVAIGKAAIAMARGARVDRGIAVSPVEGDAEGWRVIVSAHPHPDERSVAAARELRALVDSATERDVVIALISGGASALVEEPQIPLEEFVATMRGLMAAGAPIEELNTVRQALSSIKMGRLVERCHAPVVTFVASDVIGDRIHIIGSAPTIGPWLDPGGAPNHDPVDVGGIEELHREAAIAMLEARDIAVPALAPIASRIVGRPRDYAQLVLSMRAFAEAVQLIIELPILEEPMQGELEVVATRLVQCGPCITWGEPTLHVPADHGRGGRAQQLALLLAKQLRGTPHVAFVAGTDGVDGPEPDAPAGAFVDGTTWDAIRAAGIDPDHAIARRDAGTALGAVGALVVTGPTGVNHADIAIVG